MPIPSLKAATIGFVLFTASRSALALGGVQLTSVSVTPAVPTSNQPVTLLARLDSGSASISVGHLTVTRRGSSIAVDFSASSGMLTALSTAVVPISLGTLSPGFYSYTVTLNGSFPFPYSSRSGAFQVGVFTPPPRTLPLYDHVVVVVEEDHSYTQVTGTYAAAAPYLNQTLIAEGASLTRAYSEERNCPGNYLWLFAGCDLGLGQNVLYGHCPEGPYNTANLGANLIAAGYTFKGYSEGLPFIGFSDCSSGYYAAAHNPWVVFSNVPNGTTVEDSSNLRFTDFPTDYSTLPTVSFVIPNTANDMGQGSDPARIAAADAWLRTHLDGYYQWAKTHNSLLIVTWDQDDGHIIDPTSPPDNQIPTIFAGAHVIHGQYAEGNGVNHVNILRTIEDIYRLPHAGGQDSAALAAGLNEEAIRNVFVPSGQWRVPDFDLDGDVDQEDFGHLQACFTGEDGSPADPSCADTDLNGDNHTDEYDAGTFQKCLRGPSILIGDASCLE